MARGALALLLHGQAVGSWTLGNSKQDKSSTRGTRLKTFGALDLALGPRYEPYTVTKLLLPKVKEKISSFI